MLLTTQSIKADVTSERPISPHGGATEIHCSITVLDLDAVNDAIQNFTVNLFLTCRWKDARLANDGPGNVIKDVSAVWHPKIMFLNRQKLWTQTDDVVEVSPSGAVVYRKHFWGDFSQPLNMRNFPFDTQDLQISLIAAGAYGHDEVSLIQDPGNPSTMADEYSVADWKVIGTRVESGPKLLPTGETAAALTLSLIVERESQHYIVKFIAPLLMILVLSWVVFWLSPDESAQLSVGVTSCLTVIAYHLALSARLPKIPYLTHMDIFVLGATMLVFLAMIEVVVTTRLAGAGQLERAIKIDRMSRLVFPSLLALVISYAFYLR